MRVRFIGDRERLDARLVELVVWLEELTAKNELLNLTVALNYGSRDELTRAVRAIARDVAGGRLSPDDVSEKTVAANLDTVGIPDPDLVIRTSGELRLSNFLLWQSAYAEYAFVKTEWPDFTADLYRRVLESYSSRERRFGMLTGVSG